MNIRFLPTLVFITTALNKVYGQSASSLTWTVPQGGELLSFSGQMNIAVLNDPSDYVTLAGISTSNSQGSILSTSDFEGSNWNVWTHAILQPQNVTNATSLSYDGHNLPTSARDLVNFEFTKVANGWTGTTQRASDSKTKMQTFFPTSLVMTEIIFQIGYNSGSWTSGSLSFNKVHMSARTSDQTWCSQSPGGNGTLYEIGHRSVKRQGQNGAQVTCDVDKITMLRAR